MTDPRSDFVAQLRADVARAENDSAALLAEYHALTPAARRQCLILEARCRNGGCLLLHIWSTNQRGPYWYTPRYTRSPKRNAAESVPSGRARHTSDGANHWTAQVGRIDRLTLAGNTGLLLHCDHRRVFRTGGQLLTDAATVNRPARIFL